MKEVRAGRNYVVWEEFDFATAAGKVDHEIRNADAGKATAKVVHDGDTGGEWGAEMGDTFGHVALEHVIGATSCGKKFAIESEDGGGGVVDASKKDHLIAEDGASTEET